MNTQRPSDDYARLMPDVARRLLGEPNEHLSSAMELRFGNNGSLSVDLTAGAFYDHENKVGGGVLDLIRRETGENNPIAWLEENKLVAPRKVRGRVKLGPIVKTYDYQDTDGSLVLQVCRYAEPEKTFRQRRPARSDDDSKKIRDGWVWSADDVLVVPYRLPDLLARPDEPVFVVEGEKDADRLRSIGLLATCNAGGASKWTADHSRHLAGRVVYVLPDNDDPGRAHAAGVARSLHGVASEVRVVDLPGVPPKGDVSDWLDVAGNDAGGLVALCRSAPLYEPRQRIVMRPGELVSIVSEAQRALIADGAAIYQRGGTLVRPVRVDRRADRANPSAVRRDVGATVLIDVQPPWLVERMARAAEWDRPTKNGETVADPKVKYANHLLSRAGEWEFRVLHGILTAPTLAADGRAIEEPGFDQASGLLLDFEPDAFPRVPEEPTKEEAAAALALLEHPLRKFPFVDDAARSVALSANLTALIRPSLQTAPLHAFDAPVAGTGKSMLASMAGLLATGTLPAAMSQGKTPEEDEKRLTTVLHAGDPVILIDNCDHPVQGDFLCSMLTQQIVQTRILGKSERLILPCTALVMATGNNLTLAGDVSRRAVICRLDARIERPDERSFDFDPLAEIRAQRPALVVAGLTILRAYALAGRPAALSPFGNFDDWSWVRGALVWLGRADPVATRETILANDPQKGELLEVMEVWESAFGDEAVTTGAIGVDLEGNASHRELCGLLREVACRGGPYSPRSVGKWLAKHADRVVGGRRFVREGQRHWRLAGAEPLRQRGEQIDLESWRASRR